MFGVLIKHEIKQTSRSILTIIGICLTAAGVGMLPIVLRLSFFSGMGLVLTIIALVAMPGSLIALSCMRYYRSMYGQAGYFTMTIPARGRTVYWAKTTWILIVIAFGFILSALGGLLLVSSITGQGLWEVLNAALGGSSGSAISLPMAVCAVLLTIVNLVTVLIWAITYGSEGKYNHLGVGGPVIMAILGYTVNQFVGFVGLLFFPIGMDMAAGGKIVFEGTFGSLVAEITGSSAPGTPPVVGFGWLPAFLVLIATAVAWAIRSIERHTSLR